uniref:Cell wall invertase n=1 Tax=Rumex dentatus TaxID=1006352 RepID=F5B2M5_9CARY|nr:cell wall invertase [Rumex dentatus]
MASSSHKVAVFSLLALLLFMLTKSSSSNEDQPYRTAYHFQPPKNWMNDPNGPLVYKGIYHLFYQQNPQGANWIQQIVWGHSTSTDLINWTEEPIAIEPSMPFDINGCWSGSATILPDGNPAMLYTGLNQQAHQVQNLATPKNASDPYLREWVKSPNNPLMTPNVGKNIETDSFRDPSTAWLLPDGSWRVIVGSKNGTRGLASLYKSKDFVHWIEVEHPLHYADGTGIWECPDFYPVYRNGALGADTSIIGSNVKHVLKLSLFDTQHEYYTVGMYDVDGDVYVPDYGSIESDLGLRYDYGKFYASKSFFDSVLKRRVLWGWVNESCTAIDDVKKGWSGLQAIPRSVVLDKSGNQLVQWPIKEVETLRESQVDVPCSVINGGSIVEVEGITSSQADIEISFKLDLHHYKNVEKLDVSSTNPQLLCSENGAYKNGGIGPFGLLVLSSKDLEEYTAVYFRVFHDHKDKLVVLMCSDQSRSSLNPTNDKTTYGSFVDVDPLEEQIHLRTLIDHSIIESFGAEGKTCITARVYPVLAIGNNAHLFVFNNGTETVKITSLSAWSMKKAYINSGGEEKIVTAEL